MNILLSREDRALVFSIVCEFWSFFPLYIPLIQQHRSDVHRSIDSIPSAQWTTCKTWQEALNVWDHACRSGIVILHRRWAQKASTTTHLATRTQPPHPPLGKNIPRTLAPNNADPLVQTSASGTSALLPSAPSKTFPSVIVISDSESDSEIEAAPILGQAKALSCSTTVNPARFNLHLKRLHSHLMPSHLALATNLQAQLVNKMMGNINDNLPPPPSPSPSPNQGLIVRLRRPRHCVR